MTWQILDQEYEQAKIAVIGIGGGGGNMVNHMINSGIRGVDFICANTDSQDLSKIQKAKLIKLGNDQTRGLGAGNDPLQGKLAAELSLDEIEECLKNTEMVFITAGMGGGTGTGAAPVIAKLAKDMGILTIGVVTTPFKYEKQKRADQAEAGIQQLWNHVDSIIEINNEKIFETFPRNTPFKEGLNAVNNVLVNAVRAVTEVILNPATMNVDFADVEAAMSQGGKAIMGFGQGSGVNRAKEAVDNALNSPFFDKAEVRNAKGLIINICGSSSIGNEEVKEIMEHAGSIGVDGVEAIPGLTIDESCENDIFVTIIATGLRRFDLDGFQERVLRPVSPISATRPVSDGYVDIGSIETINIKDTFRRLNN